MASIKDPSYWQAYLLFRKSVKRDRLDEYDQYAAAYFKYTPVAEHDLTNYFEYLEQFDN